MSHSNEVDNFSYDTILDDLNHSIQTDRRLVGQVRWFHPKKGYGMIRNIETKKDIFAHQSELKSDSNVYRQLFPGEYVEYVEGSMNEKIKEIDSRSKKVAKFITGIGGNMLMCEYIAYTTPVNPVQQNNNQQQQEIPILYPSNANPLQHQPHQYKHMIPVEVIRTQYSRVNGVNEDLIGAPLNSFHHHIETLPDKLYNSFQQRKTQTPIPPMTPQTTTNYVPLIQYPYPQSVVPMYATPYKKRNEYRPNKNSK
jgi:cold shock CspA family protein